MTDTNATNAAKDAARSRAMALPDLVSACCHARLRLEGHDIRNPGATCWYVCEGCGEPCDAKAVTV